jgi:hypothetical protein
MTVAYPRKLNDRLSARDILTRVVNDREIHLIVLNRYRYSEQRSCKDLTAAIEQLQGQPPTLVRDLSHHVADEARHAMWLTDLLVDIGGPLDTPPGISYIDEFERLIDVSTDRSPEDTIIDTLAAINVTEKRGCEYFSAHIHALKLAPQTEENIQIRSVIERIFPEEAMHVRWGNKQLAQIAAKSPAHRDKVEAAKLKYIAIEHAAFSSGSDIMMGAELRRVASLLKVVDTLPVWERPQYLLERLPETLFSSDLQKIRLTAAKRAWERDPQAFVTQFIPMFFNQRTEDRG